MDLFADALKEFDTTWAKKGAGANLPPSQFLAPSQAMARSQEEIVRLQAMLAQTAGEL